MTVKKESEYIFCECFSDCEKIISIDNSELVMRGVDRDGNELINTIITKDPIKLPKNVYKIYISESQ